MSLFDKIKGVFNSPGVGEHGLQGYVLVHPDEFPAGPDDDVIVLDGAVDSIPEDDA